MTDLKHIIFSKDGEVNVLDSGTLYAVENVFIDGNLGSATLNGASKIKFIFCKSSNSWRKFVEFESIESIPVIKYSKGDTIYLLDFEVSLKIGDACDSFIMRNCLNEYLKKEKITG